MKILFSVQNFGFLRNFQSTVSLLAEHGHSIHIVADRADKVGGSQLLAALTAAHPGVTHEIVKSPKRGKWVSVSALVRLTIDYWRYLEPQFAQATQLRARAEDHVPRVIVLIPRLPGLRSQWARRLLMRLARAIERVIPPRPDVDTLLERRKPDLLLLTPLLYFGSKQVDYVRAARQRGIPSVLGVGSWDHLTTKGLIHEAPDRVIVWNEMQRDEACELHGIERGHVVVTGSQAYDHWFSRQVSTTRQEFCDRIGLSAAKPYLLYLCSSPFITPHEVPFIRRWITAVRSSEDLDVRSLGLMIRPHPQNAMQWKDVDFGEYGQVAIWPRAGANPIDADARAEYYDSMFHSRAVVGVNTSALIESGIVGRVVLSLVVDEFAGTQEGTLHFQHLKNAGGGLLRLASTLDEHITQVSRLIHDDPNNDQAKIRGFVQAFIRPHGLDVPATPRVVAAIEDAALLHPVAPKPSLAA
ncbi:MAG: hypothetical protein ABL982_21405, partial [Vicinamibacterales bacterium]